MILDEVTSPEGGSALDSSTSSSGKLRRLSFEDCAYRGEGNANIVIALPYERKVVRFRKSGPGEASPDGGRARIEREVEFLRHVVSGFLGAYCATPRILRGDREDMARLSEAVRPLRPEYRRDKEVIEEYATKFPDYTFLPPRLTLNSEPTAVSSATFCVEIKPKQGFLQELDWQLQKCSYCLTQYHKLKNRAIPNRSRYCPFDLFSGERNRMRRAVCALLESPQNNLKIFKDGIVVYDHDSSPGDVEHVLAEWFPSTAPCAKEEYLERFLALVCEALLRPMAREPLLPEHQLRPKTSRDLDAPSRINAEVVAKARKILYFAAEECDFTSDDLPLNSVLGRIRYMQQQPFYSADVVYSVYSKYSGTLSDEVVYSNMIERYKLLRGDPGGISSALPTNVAALKRRLRDGNGNRQCTTVTAYVENSDDFSSRYAELLMNNVNDGSVPLVDQQILENYLLFTTAKDCSILMAFQKLDPSASSGVPREHVITISDRLRFAVNVGVSDLDPKNVRCIEKHRLRDTRVLNAVIQVLEEELALKNQQPFYENQLQQQLRCSD